MACPNCPYHSGFFWPYYHHQRNQFKDGDMVYLDGITIKTGQKEGYHLVYTGDIEFHSSLVTSEEISSEVTEKVNRLMEELKQYGKFSVTLEQFGKNKNLTINNIIMENITIYSIRSDYSYLLGIYKNEKEVQNKYQQTKNKELVVEERENGEWKCKCGHWNNKCFGGLCRRGCGESVYCQNLGLYNDGKIGLSFGGDLSVVDIIGSYKL